MRQKLARDRSVNSGLLGFGNIVLTGSSLSQVAGDTGQAFKWKPGFLLDSIGGGLQALGSLPGIGVHIYKASTGWWRQRNLAKQPGQEAAAIAASLTAFNEKHGQFEKNVRDSSSWKDSLARRIDQRDRVRNDVVDVQQRHDSIANAVRDVKSKVSSEDPSLERRAEEGERLLLRAQVELRAANDRGMRSEQQVADARTERARLLATQEITAPLVTRAEEHAEAMRRYMTEPLDAHAKAGTQLHLSDVRDRLRTANARRLKAGSLGAFNTSLQAAGGLANVPMNKGMKRNIKDTQGYANIGTDITAANAAADLAEIQYRKGGATEEHRETTARVLYTSLGRGAAHPPVPAVPAADAIDRLVGQRAAVIAQDTPENVRDMADVVRPALSDPTVKSLEKPLMADKGWSMLEHIGIPRTDVDQADVPDDVIEYVKASIPDD